MKKRKEAPAIKSYKLIAKNMGWFTKKIVVGYDKVRKKFLDQMLRGIIGSGSCLLSNICYVISRQNKIHHKDEKRLSAEMRNKNWDTEKIYDNQSKLQGCGDIIDENTIIGLDIMDINKRNGKVYENLTKVHDGSMGEIVSGYWSVVIEAIKGKGNHFPISMKLYSDKAKGFKSQWDEIYQEVKHSIKYYGKKGLWVMDRGFDTTDNFIFFNNIGLKFLIRGYHNRIVKLAGGKEGKINEIIKTKELQGIEIYYKHYVEGFKGNRKIWKKKNIKIGYDYLPIEMVYGREEEKEERAKLKLTVLIVKGIGKKDEISFFFTNEAINNLNDCIKILKKYSMRWGCEEAIRFVKQSFNFEDVRVQGYESIRRMLVLCMISYTYICLFIKIFSEKHKRTFYWLRDLVVFRRKEIFFLHYKILEAIQKILNLIFIDSLNLWDFKMGNL